MSNVVTSELDTCLGKRHHLQLHLDPDTCPDDPSRPMPSKLSRPPPITDDKPPEAVAAKRPCTMAARLDAAAAISSQPFYTATATAANAAAAAAAAATTTATTTTADTTATTAPAPIDVANSNTTPGSLSFGAGGGPSRDGNVLSEWDAASWDTNSAPGFDFMPRKGPASEHDDVPGQYAPPNNDAPVARTTANQHRSIDESCRRALDHFPCPAVAFPTPTLEFDFRVAVTLKPEPSQVQGRAHKEITAISSGNWSGSFGHGKVMVCQAHVCCCDPLLLCDLCNTSPQRNTTQHLLILSRPAAMT